MLTKKIEDTREFHTWMGFAIKEAEIAFEEDEVPVGAIIVDDAGVILARSRNSKEKSFNPCYHAEMIAIQSAANRLENWRLTNCTLYVTLEPCPMCLAALVHARIKRLVFGAYDFKGGSLSLNYKFNNDYRLNHSFEVVGGICEERASYLMKSFFKQKRLL